MTEMLERVAQAIYENGRTRWPPAYWTDASEADKKLSRGYARAAIEAMREPTEELVTAGSNAVAWHPADEPTEEAPKVWRAMVKAALDGLPQHLLRPEP